jgi:predicted ATPase
MEGYEDGVWLVELDPLSDPGLVPQAVATALGVREVSGSPILETLAGHLRSRIVLIVLDNCEHLLGPCASLAEALLRSCPNLSILATSRQALGVEGEKLFLVPPLSLPDPRRLPASDGLADYEAASLFVERARAVRPDSALTDRNAMAVAQICHRLEGMPLAIELAAARARVLSAEQISSRLEGSFALLASGGRTTVAYHGTLRATMDWSHELLSEEERVLFRRLLGVRGGMDPGGLRGRLRGRRDRGGAEPAGLAGR